MYIKGQQFVKLKEADFDEASFRFAPQNVPFAPRKASLSSLPNAG
jgi:hypothetical protein